MTKVTLHYDLDRPLNDEDCEQIGALHDIYGIVRVQLAPTLDKITVDYDASRLMKADVESEILKHGVPIRVTALA